MLHPCGAWHAARFGGHVLDGWRKSLLPGSERCTRTLRSRLVARRVRLLRGPKASSLSVARADTRCGTYWGLDLNKQNIRQLRKRDHSPDVFMILTQRHIFIALREEGRERNTDVREKDGLVASHTRLVRDPPHPDPGGSNPQPRRLP